MVYEITIEKNATQELLKLEKKDKKSFNILNKKILNLSIDPIPKNKNHIIKRNDNTFFYELSYKTIRVYYEIINNKIKIQNIEFEGYLNILNIFKNHKNGSKNYSNQQKYINEEKKRKR